MTPLELLSKAANEPFGILVKTKNPERLQQACYREKKKHFDLPKLKMRVRGDALIIYKETPDDEK